MGLVYAENLLYNLGCEGKAQSLSVIACHESPLNVLFVGLCTSAVQAGNHKTHWQQGFLFLNNFFALLFVKVQHNPQYQAAFVNEMVSFLMLISQVQNDTSLWRLLLLAPDVFQGSMQLQDIMDFLQNPSR